ncbi:PDZ domain-containing protein [Rhodovastum atsumiense]|uniref:PDZ domain-containing protein n=1 Tax=Rhodovastum atsumiense TaxID=504468 RepID=A0A5M6J216_9PROT|nr:S41 family peptidase [Rhodovastum atsumiense]KAA5614656.1 PDZ domain-containing protein [Rhodovastum atsumiense]CAH2599816.1 PDZ domain-containing protein [Rhodovastum atsumiense]
MRTAWLLLLPLLFGGPAALAEPFLPGQGLNAGLVAQVSATALDFIAPRTLDPVPVSQLAVWGLRGLTSLDPRLSAELRDNTLRLASDGQGLLLRPSPPDDDAEGWGEAVAQMVRAAWDRSEAVRQAGTQGIIRSFFDELFNHLDPYSRYAAPAEADAERARRTGRAGIGVQLARRNRQIVVQDVATDGPAARAGVRPGDRILAVDGQNTNAASPDAVTALLNGPEGTRVSLLLRGHDGRRRRVDLERALVPPETVVPTRIGELLVLRISAFAGDTGLRLAHELERGLAANRPPRGVVVDLRGNRGGLLRQAVAAADTLIPEGVVTMTLGRDPDADHEFRADGPDLASGVPVVVMVDGRSASAAEILAAALADQRRAVVVGSSTLGKGLVQTIAPLPDGGELLVTWSRVLAPLGWPIQGLGVLPQVCTSLGGEALDQQLAELAQGRQMMARPLHRHRAARAPLPAPEILEIRNACPAAEGRDADLSAARFLIETPSAYGAALIGPPPARPQAGP